MPWFSDFFVYFAFYIVKEKIIINCKLNYISFTNSKSTHITNLSFIANSNYNNTNYSFLLQYYDPNVLIINFWLSKRLYHIINTKRLPHRRQIQCPTPKIPNKNQQFGPFTGVIISQYPDCPKRSAYLYGDQDQGGEIVCC